MFPSDHWRSFVEPDRLGHPGNKDWAGDRRLRPPLNNYTETTIYLGLLTIPLALLGIFRRRAVRAGSGSPARRSCWRDMFGTPVIAPWVSTWPGFKFSALARVGLLLPLPIGYLAAAGARVVRRPFLALLFAALIAYDLALVAGRFYPYLEAGGGDSAGHADGAVSPRRSPAVPHRAVLRLSLAEFVGAGARRGRAQSLQLGAVTIDGCSCRLDPTAWSGASTVITFNSLKYDFRDPLNALLGIRWFIEHNHIDIIKMGHLQRQPCPVLKLTGSLASVPPRCCSEPSPSTPSRIWAIELPVDVTEARGANARLEVRAAEGRRGGLVASLRTMTRPTCWTRFTSRCARTRAVGETATLRVRSFGMSGWMLKGVKRESARGRKQFYGRVTTPVIFDPPAAGTESCSAISPSCRASAPVSKLRKLNDDEFLAARDVDFETEAVDHGRSGHCRRRSLRRRRG